MDGKSKRKSKSKIEVKSYVPCSWPQKVTQNVIRQSEDIKKYRTTAGCCLRSVPHEVLLRRLALLSVS